jgi:hypothetical protein
MKLYADARYLPDPLPHCPLLYPFWGDTPRSAFQLGPHRFKRYIESGPQFFALTPLNEADAAILPFQWEQAVPEAIRVRGDLALHGQDHDVIRTAVESALERATSLAAEADRASKPLAVFFVHYEGATPSLPNAWTFRSSLYASRRAPHEFAQPFWFDDPIVSECGGQLPLRSKTAKPTVGFCGLVVARGLATLPRRLSRAMTAWPDLPLALWRMSGDRLVAAPFRPRARALALLRSASEVDTRFILRARWFNGLFEQFSLPLLRESRTEYLENVLGNDYVLCTRGHGNCSIRLYETLACGRIPVFVNTDCVLPYEPWIDWKQYCVWVDEQDLAQIAEKVAAFHDRLTPSGFQDLQRACRELWLEWLSPQGFFKNFHRHFGAS